MSASRPLQRGEYLHSISDKEAIILRQEPESIYNFPDAPKPTLRNPWKSRDGIAATVLTASLLLLAAAIAIFILWPILIAAAATTLAIMAVCAVVGIAALSVVAAFGADHCCGDQSSADEAEDKLLTSTYSEEFSDAGVYDASLHASATADELDDQPRQVTEPISSFRQAEPDQEHSVKPII